MKGLKKDCTLVMPNFSNFKVFFFIRIKAGSCIAKMDRRTSKKYFDFETSLKGLSKWTCPKVPQSTLTAPGG